MPDTNPTPQPITPPEGLRITAAAARFGGELILSLPRPARHHHITLTAISLGLDHEKGLEFGFLLNNGMYATRKESYEIAKAANQLLKDNGPGTLFSEELW